MMKKYELVLALSPDLDDAAVALQIEKISSLASQHSGSIVKQEILGRKQLAYRIKKRDAAIFAVLILEGDNTLYSDLDRQLRITESVIRHSMVSKDKYAPDAQLRVRDEDEGGGFLDIPGVGPDLAFDADVDDSAL